MRQLRHHLGVLVSALAGALAATRPSGAAADREWVHSRNALGIARLLVHEGRPEELVGTACRMSVEAACRVALEHAGFPYDGDLERSLWRLSAPKDLLQGLNDGPPATRLAACERALGFLSAYLRSESPGRSWAF
jgi:hypothetical protein